MATQWLVTIKLPHNPAHDPRNKHVDVCPANPNTLCTDATGDHHTLLVAADHVSDVPRMMNARGFTHVTRIEGV